MMNRVHSNRFARTLAMGALACIAGWTSTAYAGDIEVDIDRLAAEAWFTQNQWHIGVRYKVEIEDAPANPNLRIRFTMTEDGRVVVDARGRPVQIELEMDQIERADDGKLVYSDVLTIDLPKETLARCERVKLRASVHWSDGGALGSKEVRVRYRYEPPWEPVPAR